MFFKSKKNNNINENINILKKSIDKLEYKLAESRIVELSEILGNNKKLVIKNFSSGLFKGLGTGIGFYIITALVILLLNYIVKLNIPIIGKYITDIVEIVEVNRR